MKRVLQADKIKVVAIDDATPQYIDKEDFEALVVQGTAGAKITVKDAIALAGTGEALYKEYQMAAGQTQIDIDLTGTRQFVQVDGAIAVFGDKRDVNKVYGAQPDHELHETYEV